MTALLALTLALPVQGSTPPTLPIGCSLEFARAVQAVEARLVEGDAAGAREAARALPLRAPRIAWDDAGLPTALRASREAKLEEIVRHWRVGVSPFAPIFGGDAPDATIGFAPVLPGGAEGLPLPAKVEFGPPFRATIGLSRGKPGVPLRSEELNQEIAFVLGRYLGVPELPVGFNGSAMRQDPYPNLRTFWPRPDEMKLAAQNLDFADRVREAVAAGKPLGLAYPTVRLARKALDLGDVEQSKPLRTTIDLENLGAGTLEYHVVPDCGCFSTMPPGRIAPQGRGQVVVTINTQEYMTRVDKMLLLESNDPAQPRIEIPVTFRAHPAYRLVHPGGDRVVASPGGATYDFFLFTPPGSDIHVVSYHWGGMDAKVTWEPWSGTLADPELGEGPLPRTGWRFHVRVPPTLPTGRASGTLSVETDSRTFPTLLASLTVQKGIVADEAVNFGDIEPGAKASLLVDRPNAPFKITGVDAGPLKATVTPRRGGWEYRIDLEYKGGAQKGDLEVPIRIRTDDPKQPVVESSAHGYVK